MGRRETWNNVLFAAIFLATLALPLRNGLPSLQDALPPPSPTFSKVPCGGGAGPFLPPNTAPLYTSLRGPGRCFITKHY